MKINKEQELTKCPDCKTNEHVKLWSSPNELTMSMLYIVKCSNKICQKQWASLDREAKKTDSFSKESDAVKAWNEGRYNNYRFSYKDQWTGT